MSNPAYIDFLEVSKKNGVFFAASGPEIGGKILTKIVLNSTNLLPFASI